MVKTFSKVLVLSLLVVALAIPAFATTARVNSLAGTGDYMNDDSNMFRWYGVLPSYANLVMMEVGTWDGSVEHRGIGVTHACGEEGKWGTWGLWLLEDHVSDDSFFMNSPVWYAAIGYNDVGVSYPSNKIALAWGKEFEAMSFGINFTRSDMSIENETVDPVARTDWSFTTVGAGIRADIGDDAYTDLAVTIGFGGYDVEGAVANSLDKKMALDFAARIFYEWKDNVTFVPVIDYMQYEYALETAVEPHGDKVRAFFGGGAMNMDVNTNNMLIVGAQIEYVNWEYSAPGDAVDEFKMWTLPRFFIALESNVKPWLTARVGAWKALDKVTDTFGDASDPPVAQDVITTGADFDWFLGLGFHVAEFDIDCELGEDAPFNMGYWLTGYEDWDNDPIGRISATYHF
jgi:hypothetical protein